MQDKNYNIMSWQEDTQFVKAYNLISLINTTNVFVNFIPHQIISLDVSHDLKMIPKFSLYLLDKVKCVKTYYIYFISYITLNIKYNCTYTFGPELKSSTWHYYILFALSDERNQLVNTKFVYLIGIKEKKKCVIWLSVVFGWYLNNT